jgi:hypothetical protein
MMTLKNPGPSTTTVMIASRIAGTDRKMSTTRMMIASGQPRT